MELKELTKRALEIRNLYSELETKKYGKTWTNAQIMEGFVGDVGDLMKIIMAKEGVRDMEDVDEKIKHEMADCLWSILVLAEKYNVDLEEAFFKNMKILEERIKKEQA